MWQCFEVEAKWENIYVSGCPEEAKKMEIIFKRFTEVWLPPPEFREN